VRDLGDDAEIVRDEEHAGSVARLQVADQRKNLRLRGDVERGSGLIGDQQHRVEHQRHRDHDALALAARQLVRVGRHHSLGIRQPHLAHDVEDLRAALLRGELRVLDQHFVDLLAAAHHRVERGHRLLEDHRHARRAQLALPLRRRARRVFAFEQHLAAGDRQRVRQEAHDPLRDHRLAGTRLADEADDLAAIDRERDLRHRFLALAAGGKRDRQVAHLEHAHTRFAIFGSSVSRRPSPMMFTASTVTARNTPGRTRCAGTR
jgi:hypothetical protein